MLSADRVQLAYAPESQFGVTPNTGSPAKFLRMTGESLSFELSKEVDKELNATAEQTSSTTVGAQASGDIKVHMQYAEYDPFLASVCRSVWAPHGTNGVGTTFSGTFTATTITAGAAAGFNVNLLPGQWFRLNAPGNANDGKFFRNSTSVAATATVITVDASTPLSTGTSVAGCSIATARLTNGTTLSSFTIERQIAEASPAQVFAFRGMYGSKFSTQFASRSLTEATFTFLGKDSLRKNGSTYMPGTIAQSQTYDIQNGVTGVGNIWEGGAPLANTVIKSISLDIDSGLRAQDALGVLGLAGVGIGTFVVSGSLEVYFADGAMYDKFLNDVYTSLTFSTKDAANNGYVIQLPRVQLSNGKIQAGSKNSDLMATFDYTAFADKGAANAALRGTIFIDRVGAAVAP